MRRARRPASESARSGSRTRVRTRQGASKIAVSASRFRGPSNWARRSSRFPLPATPAVLPRHTEPPPVYSVHVVVPTDTPRPILEEMMAFGADLQLLDGLISDCGRVVKQGVEQHGWFDLSTLKEPYRLEGKKTMGYELHEQLGGRLPDSIVYPTGGGTGLIGMWKAFDEMERLGWIGSERPKMFTVQASGCAPMVRAWEAGRESAEMWQGAATYAAGLCVPGAVGDFLILRALRESGGGAVAVADHVMAEWVRHIGTDTGIFAAPEGGATAAAVPVLMEKGLIAADDEVVLFNTGSGLKYVGMEPID